MSLTVQEKEKMVAQVNAIALASKSLVVANYSGTTAVQMTKLRSLAKSTGVDVSVVPNRLAKRAFIGTDMEVVNDELKQPLVYMFAKDEPSSAAKLLVEFIKECQSLEPVAITVGNRAFSISDLEMVSKLPTKDEALAMLLSCMKAPITKLVQTTQAPIEKLVRTLDAVRSSKSNG